MPKRPISHQLEEASRRRFREALPTVWVSRKADPDYGIDESVELFSPDGTATGLSFLVQLKSTDSEDLKDALSISLSIDTFKYYKKLEPPVMIVSYHQPTNSLFWRWAHEMDVPVSSAQKTFSFKIPSDQEWNINTPERIQSELTTFRQLRSASLKLPLPFELIIEKPLIDSLTDVLVESSVKGRLSKFSTIVILKDDFESFAHPTLIVSRTKVSANLAGLSSVTLHSNKPYDSKESVQCLPDDLISAIAILFDRMGHSDIASRLFAESLQHTQFRHNSKFFLECMRTFVKADRKGDALALAEKFIREEQDKELAEILLLSPLFSGEELSTAEEQFYFNLMKLTIDIAERDKDFLRAASKHYTLGNRLRAKGSANGKAAFRQYRLAAKKDPEYKKRPYFWHELGGLLFSLGMYLCSSKAYGKSIEIEGDKNMNRALMADALMYSGRYGQALEELRKHLHLQNEPESEWILKEIALSHIIKFVGTSEQKRSQVDLNKILSNNELSANQKKELLLESLRSDALSVETWFEMGVITVAADDHENAFKAFLISALINVHSPRPWINCIFLGSTVEEFNKILPDIVAVAYNKFGYSLIEEVYQHLVKQPKEVPKKEILEILNQLIESLPKHGESRVLRIIEPTGKYREINLRQNSSRKSVKESS